MPFDFHDKLTDIISVSLVLKIEKQFKYLFLNFPDRLHDLIKKPIEPFLSHIVIKKVTIYLSKLIKNVFL